MKSIKSILTGCMLLSTASTAFAQDIQLKGNIRNLGNVDINLYYYEGAEQKASTIKTTDGKFEWKNKMPEAQKVLLLISKRAAWVYLEPGNISITGVADSLDLLKVSGSKIQQEADAFKASQEPLSKQLRSLYADYGKETDKEKLAREEKISGIKNEMREMENKYIVANPESAFSISLVTEHANRGADDYKDIHAIYDLLGQKAKASTSGKRIADRLAVLKRSGIGEQMLNFTQNDVNGNPVSFTAFKGKYVLVDFWASWCGPCRGENPNVLKAYNTYKDKNFTVVGISLDDKGENWKKAIKDDNLPWSQLSDLKGWANEVSQYYGIGSIPSTLLVDPQGKIIAKNLRGEVLNKKLKELFDDKSK